MRRIIEFIDWAARVHFIGTMVAGGAGWIVTFFAASAGGWDPVAVWLASLGAGACCALIFIAFRLSRLSQEATPPRPPIPVSVKATHDQKAELIKSARQLVIDATARDGVETDFRAALERSPVYLALRPHLSAEFRKKVNGRIIIVPPDGTRLPGLAHAFLDELDQIERGTIASSSLPEIRSFYNSWLFPTAQNVDQVLRRIMNAMRKSTNAAIRSQEGLIQRSIVDEERAALSNLSNAIRGIEPTSDEDLQNRIGRYYSAYQSCRTWIVKGLELTGVDLRSDAIFQEWMRLDEKFLDRLRQLTGPSKYDRLRELINAVGWGENITRDLRGGT